MDSPATEHSASESFEYGFIIVLALDWYVQKDRLRDVRARGTSGCRAARSKMEQSG